MKSRINNLKIILILAVTAVTVYVIENFAESQKFSLISDKKRENLNECEENSLKDEKSTKPNDSALPTKHSRLPNFQKVSFVFNEDVPSTER